MRRANVTIKRVWIGDDTTGYWQSIPSTQPPRKNDAYVKIVFQVGHVRNRKETIDCALRRLVREGVIVYFRIGAVASAPEVICRPAKDIVARVHASGRVDNGYVLGVRDELRKVLNELSA